ncbi:SWIM zinc finger family protein [Pleionea sp. CnH1-48]|uniref:SWIM zinc finger family protein n=1 Tax=Pleionea sp. CnH1-48 TaxID=2954494 RepID=UPI002098049B|nr:SWIM zinc finger family protein [Pleionea sp. CnH1-48]MCO7225107.1 SWIM zinc finger family protein [Pleionea sp. CnH1-48]
MEFRYRYQGSSKVSTNSANSQLSFSPDSLREPTYFVGKLHQKLAFREAISALHNVVISDMRFQPRDLTEYKTWLESEEQRMLAEFIARGSEAEAKATALRSELSKLNRDSYEVLKPYYEAQNKYFKYLYKHDMDAWWVLDPVITVHPDEIFFECFSEDESSYGKLSCRHDVFKEINEHACGTTNIDYSQGLYDEFQKIRNYRETELKVDPEGFAVSTTGEDTHEEKKIDLPESWVRGFLQVSSAMTLPLVQFDLHPMDIHNLCYLLRRNKERVGPRALRYELTPGEPIVIVLEPWNHKIVCSRSIYQGSNAAHIRTWGRRRLHILERLIPVANKFTVYLTGDGLPSFYIADLGDMAFTLGLSGWTANNWSHLGNFDLMAPRGDVDEVTLKRVYSALLENWVESSSSLAQRLGLEEQVVKSALSRYCQQGQVLYDLQHECYRIRALTREELPMSLLRFANEREEKANRFVDHNLVTVTQKDHSHKTLNLSGKVMDNAVEYSPKIQIDDDNRMTQASCDCHFYHENKLRKGPCEHMLALRACYQQQTA